MKADREYSVGMEEGLFDSIAMVDIDVQVEHPRVGLEQLQNA